MAIGRREQGRGQRWDGIECGALVLSPEIFDSLAALSKRRRYFTLADGLDILAGMFLCTLFYGTVCPLSLGRLMCVCVFLCLCLNRLDDT